MRLILGGNVQKAKRAKEEKRKGREMEEGGRRFKYLSALNFAAVQTNFHRLPKKASVPGGLLAGGLGLAC